MEGKTVVAIAHRLSTIAVMDRLIVLDHGRIVEQGDHRSLLAHGGWYARLWAHQSGGFLGEEADEADEAARGGAAPAEMVRRAVAAHAEPVDQETLARPPVSRRLEPPYIAHERLTGPEPPAP